MSRIKKCYPWREAITSFLPCVDEMVVVWNTLHQEGRQEAATLDSKIRLVQSAFDLHNYGWISYGIMRTTGYQAAKGEVIAMFDADGILHEKDIPAVREVLGRMGREKIPHAYWEKYRIYKPTLYFDQHKHSGIYNKSVLGDKFDFFGKHLGTPNWDLLPNIRSLNTGIWLYGYEHLWDTVEVFEGKVELYGQMKDRDYATPYSDKYVYLDVYLRELRDKVREKGKSMSIESQPKIIQAKLKAVDQKCFGYNFFEEKYAGVGKTG